MYLKRKSFAFNSDRPGAGGEDGRDIFERALKTVDVTFQVGGHELGLRAWGFNGRHFPGGGEWRDSCGLCLRCCPGLFFWCYSLRQFALRLSFVPQTD